MTYLKKIPFIFTILSFLSLFTSSNADIKVVASIKPIHSLTSYLMDGVGKPDLIVDGYASPHGFAMKPSHAKMLQEADIIFADPPFHQGMSQLFLTWIRNKVQPDSRLVIEYERDQDLDLQGFEVIRELKAGIDWLRLLRRTS